MIPLPIDILLKKEDRFTCPKGYSSIGNCYYKGEHYYYFSPRPFLFMRTDPERMKVALYKRRKIEVKFGEAKKHHGMTRARYKGKWRVSIQVLMSFIVMNLKRVVKLFKIREECEVSFFLRII